MPLPSRIEGYAIVSADGMLADHTGVMPRGLYIPADQAFFIDALDRCDVVAHGRHSQESHPHSARRKRIILTRRVAALLPDPANPNAVLWNPAGASLEQAWDFFATARGTLAVLGGAECFTLFLPRFDAFYLSRAPQMTLPGGRPVFPGVPAKTPEQILADAGLRPGPCRVLDSARDVTMTCWLRSPADR